eukprot:2857743-Rhodomonas_salina.3
MAAAAAAEQLAAQQAIAQGLAAQKAILQQTMAQQDAFRDHVSKNLKTTSAKKLSYCLPGGTAIFNQWALEFTAYYAARHYDWVLCMLDTEMVNHPHFPMDPPIVLVGDALMEAQAEVDEQRKKAQEEVHGWLVQTCSKEYFTECSQIKLTFPNCCSMLWRAILMANNPDCEEHINSLRAGLWSIVDSFKGKWIKWFKKIDPREPEVVDADAVRAEAVDGDLLAVVADGAAQHTTLVVDSASVTTAVTTRIASTASAGAETRGVVEMTTATTTVANVSSTNTLVSCDASNDADAVIFVSNAVTHPEELVLLDGGCTSHLHPDASRLVQLRQCNKQVQFGDQRAVRSTQCGDWPVKFKAKDDSWVSTLFKNVLVCTAIPGPIISEKRMHTWGHDILSRAKVTVVLNARTNFDNIE